MAALNKGSAVPEDSISALPEGDDISIALSMPELPTSDIFLDDTSLEEFETERVQVPTFGKHKKNMFYMRKDDPAWNKRIVGCIDVGMGDTYVLHPSVLPHLLEHGVIKRRIFTLMDREGDMLFAGYKIPDEDGNLDTWNQSAHRILNEDWACNTWFKIMSMKKAGKYQARKALNQDIPKPEWPTDKTFDELFLEAVKDRFINSLDHAVAKSILGAE